MPIDFPLNEQKPLKEEKVAIKLIKLFQKSKKGQALRAINLYMRYYNRISPWQLHFLHLLYHSNDGAKKKQQRKNKVYVHLCDIK